EGQRKLSGRRMPSPGPAALAAGLLLLLTSPAPAAEFEVIHAFTNGSADGSWPSGQLDMDQDGALYGTTARGGSACPTASYSCGGTVYKLSRPKKGTTEWRHKVVAGFKGGRD